MLEIPITQESFSRSFLGGKGKLTVSSLNWQALFDANRSFTPEDEKFSSVDVSVEDDEIFRFGEGKGVELSIGGGVQAEHSISLIWPGSPADSTMKQFNLAPLEPAEFYARLRLDTTARLNAAGKVPAGPVSIGFSAKTGNRVEYGRFKAYPNDGRPARDVILDLVNMSLPQQVTAVSRIPSAKEVIISQYDGYLELGATLNWGYQFAGSQSIDIRELDLGFKYDVRLAASTSFGYRLAGSFEMQARRGEFNAADENKWARFIVSKSRQSNLNFAADFGFEADFELTGLPATADDFLSRIMGANAERVLQGLDGAARFSKLESLKEKLQSRFTSAVLDDLAMEWLGDALDQGQVKTFLGLVGRTVKEYQSLDSRIIQLAEDVLGNVPGMDKIAGVLDILTGLRDREGLQLLINRATPLNIEGQAWDLVKRYWGDRLYNVLLDQDEINAVSSFAAEAKDFLASAEKQPLRDLIGKLKEASKLDPLFQQLAKFDSPEKLRQQADERLKGLVESIFGKAFEEIGESELGKKLEGLHQALGKIQQFKSNTYAQILNATGSQSFSAELAYQYSRTDARSALIDVEVNLAHPTGREFARLASHGRFRELLLSYDSDVVRVHEGVLTHQLTRTTQLKVNLFGWGYSRLVEIVSDTEHLIESHAGGLLNIYTTAASVKQKTERGREANKEVTTSAFLLKAVSQRLQPGREPGMERFVADTLQDMSVQYDLTVEDPKTKFGELTMYLGLAENLGLIASAIDYQNRLEDEFPNGLGEVKASYVVRYNYDEVMSAFDLDTDHLRPVITSIMRSYLAAKYTGMSSKAWLRPAGYAYLQGSGFRFYTEPRFFNESTVVQALTPEGPRRLSRGAKALLRQFYSSEAKYVQRLIELDSLVDQLIDNAKQGAAEPVPVEEFEQAARRFVSMAPKLDHYRDNAFFCVFDMLIRNNSGGKRGGRSALVLEITPPGSKQTVTKYLMAERKAAFGSLT